MVTKDRLEEGTTGFSFQLGASPAGVPRSMRILVGILADLGYQESKAFKGRECSMLYKTILTCPRPSNGPEYLNFGSLRILQ